MRANDRRVLLADDQAEVRIALRLLLEEALALTDLGEVADGAALLGRVRATHPALLLLD